MSGLEDIVARGLRESNLNLTPAQFRSLTSRVVSEIRAHADEVRAEMELEVWGMVR